MAENSKIEWTTHTFNPWEGCTKVSAGCTNCYAEARNHRFGLDNWGKGKPRRRTSESNWRKPIKWNDQPLIWDAALKQHRKARVFCASLADWLDDEVPIEWLADLLKLIHDTPNLDWLLLTKRPENFFVMVLHAGMELMGYVDGQKSDRPEALADAKGDTIESVLGWSKGETFPENVWIGTTVENQEYADKRIPELLKIPAKVRFLSCEPLLEAVSLPLTKPMPLYDDEFGDQHEYAEVNRGIHWCIVGGESGPRKRPFNCDWARSIRMQCEEAKTAFFMKQVDKVQPIPDDLWVQEFPV